MMGFERFLICIVRNLKSVQFVCGEVPFKYTCMHDVAGLKFYINSTPKCSFLYSLNHVFLLEHKYAKYDIDNMYDTLHNLVTVIQLKFYELVLNEYL